jgi:hypothetical protein
MRREGGLVWRVPLMIAVTAMVLAAVAAVFGQKAVADVVVTGGFAIGMLAVPIWLVTRFRKEA